MKKIFLLLSAAAALSTLVSCDLPWNARFVREEWEPVTSFNYDNPSESKIWTEQEIKTRYGVNSIISIKELARKYRQGVSWNVTENYVLSGVVCSTDQPGNFYKSFFIEDGTGGIEIKVGRNSLYNNYRPGQRVFVILNGLSVGMYGYKSGNYGGMGTVQVGASRNLNENGTPADEYETSYIENAVVYTSKILCGPVECEDEQGRSVLPVPMPITSESQLPNGKSDTQATNKYIGSLVTISGLKYANQIFCLLYLDPAADKKSFKNRVFLSDTNGITTYGKAHGVTTWAMSETKMREYVTKGYWDECKVGSGNSYLQIEDPVTHTMRDATVGDLKGDGTYPKVAKQPYTVNQYFKLGGTEVQVRTSGYCKFSDREIDPAVLSGARTMSITGVLTLYQGGIQLTVNDYTDFVVE